MTHNEPRRGGARGSRRATEALCTDRFDVSPAHPHNTCQRVLSLSNLNYETIVAFVCCGTAVHRRLLGPLAKTQGCAWATRALLPACGVPRGAQM